MSDETMRACADAVALRRRATILRTIREFFDSRDFIEVETFVRIPAPANEPFIIPPESNGEFLRASPELQMKKLLCKGIPRIYQIGPCFRENERGARHNPEFTMLEWYRANSDYMEILNDMRGFVCACAEKTLGTTTVSFNGSKTDVGTEWEVIPVRDAYLKYAGWNPLENFDENRFDEDMALKIEPALPKDRPCVLIGYPAQAASLSKLSENDSRTAERWEAYICGMELCNAFSELTNATEQRSRFMAAAAKKVANGEKPMPLDNEFLAALEHGMPPSGGAALGVDRLCMILSGLTDITRVRA